MDKETGKGSGSNIQAPPEAAPAKEEEVDAQDLMAFFSKSNGIKARLQQIPTPVKKSAANIEVSAPISLPVITNKPVEIPTENQTPAEPVKSQDPQPQAEPNIQQEQDVPEVEPVQKEEAFVALNSEPVVVVVEKEGSPEPQVIQQEEEILTKETTIETKPDSVEVDASVEEQKHEVVLKSNSNEQVEKVTAEVTLESKEELSEPVESALESSDEKMEEQAVLQTSEETTPLDQNNQENEEEHVTDEEQVIVELQIDESAIEQDQVVSDEQPNSDVAAIQTFVYEAEPQTNEDVVAPQEEQPQDSRPTPHLLQVLHDQDSVPNFEYEPEINRRQSAVARDINTAINSHLLSQMSSDNMPPTITEEESVAKITELGSTEPAANEQTKALSLLVHEFAEKETVEQNDAKDLVLKLYARIGALEDDLKNARKLQEDTVLESRLQIEKKNEFIDSIRVRMQRYEYAIKESAVFLSKPLREYQAALDHTRMEKQGVQITVSAVTEASKNTEEFNSNQPPSMRVKPHATLDPATTAAPLVPIKEGSKATASAPENKNAGVPMTVFEIRCIESIRLAHQYLYSVQKIIETANNKEPVESAIPKLNESLDDSTALSKINVDKEQPPLPPPSATPNSASTTSPSRQLSTAALPLPATTTKQNSFVHRANTISSTKPPVIDDEGDLGDAGIGEGGSLAFNKRCENCRGLLIKIDHLNDTISQQKKSISKLTKEVENQKSLTKKVQIEKELVEEQLEDLTIELFVQANKLVADEAKLRDSLEQNVRQLDLSVKEWKKKCSTREADLRERLDETDALRKHISLLEKKIKTSAPPIEFEFTETKETNMVSSTLAVYAKALGTENKTLAQIAHTNKEFRKSLYQMGANANPQNPSVQLPVIFIDGVIYAEFQDHIRQVMKETTTNPIISHSTAFMRRCLADDVEPCLFYSIHTPDKGSSLLKMTPPAAMSSSMKKKLLDAVSKGGCEIQSFLADRQKLQTTKTANVNGQDVSIVSTGPPKAKCFACGMHRECEFRFRFMAPASEWMSCCRFCKERLVNVCDFYAYMLQIRNKHHETQTLGGHQQALSPTSPSQMVPSGSDTTLLGMFRHTLWLRRRMSASRIGNIGLFESDVMTSLVRFAKIPVVVGSSQGIPGDWEPWVHVVQ